MKITQLALAIAILSSPVDAERLRLLHTSRKLQGKGANKPDQEQPERVWPEYVNGNHFTLNIHGRDKYSERDCEADIKYTHPTDPDVVCTGPNEPAGCVLSTYGNSIFVLNAGATYKNGLPLPTGVDTTTQIMFSSGNVKGKLAKNGDFNVYGVRDPCTAAWDGNAAEVTLPPENEGYYIVLRMLGKPAKAEGDSSFGIINANITNAVDGSGNDLWLLGLVTSNGFETPDVQVREKGKSKAVDISAVFDFNGEVCYFGESFL